ncbi:MAG: AraC family transcriptional regulator [Cyanobacteria bacterium P01_B01_bin.77]
MALNLSWQDATDLWIEAAQSSVPGTVIDDVENLYTVPAKLGRGYHRIIDLPSGIELIIFDYVYRDLALEIPENQHPIQFTVHLSGTVDSGDYLYRDANWGYIGGSGVQRSLVSVFPESQRQLGVSVQLQPQLLQQFFGDGSGELPGELQPLVKDTSQWQQIYSPKTTGNIRSVVRQIMDCPLAGLTKQMYLQGKVFELMALQIEETMERPRQPITLKPETTIRIHQAAAILRSHLETPPSATELAKQMGVCDRTLRRGFKQVFGTTLVGYLTQQRLHQAQQRLCTGDYTVAEVANQVGYAHLGHFAAAFKRQFGITPSQCMTQKSSVYP